MDAEVVELFSAGRGRRDVQALREALTQVSAGDTARVVVRSPRYGLYVVDGSVRMGVGGQPVIGDVILGTGTEIQRLVTDIAPVVAAEDGSVSIDGADHGSLVRVTLETPAHGLFQITGPLTAGHDDLLLVGSWIVFDGGMVAPRVVTVERFDDADVHAANIPSRRAAMDEASV